LGIGAHLATLRRTRSGGLTLSDAVGLDAVDRDPDLALRALVPPSRMLLHLPAVNWSGSPRRRGRPGFCTPLLFWCNIPLSLVQIIAPAYGGLVRSGPFVE